ncbi:reverse transcriptase domain, Ribonuclease H-like domain protein [Artemisia annua]|uniref:Reverse transcriptase domain, Ribonuclease H-like domain protein n=1 Tax=Artemisia annua TaxID=35608 RepID=A0A2U1LKE8_ARTAN|nr:reverse transcriptase domain, Ribonuclease H-like domain protein [Artemisia annua]
MSKRQRDDNDLQDERQDQIEEEEMLAHLLSSERVQEADMVDYENASFTDPNLNQMKISCVPGVARLIKERRKWRKTNKRSVTLRLGGSAKDQEKREGNFHKVDGIMERQERNFGDLSTKDPNQFKNEETSPETQTRRTQGRTQNLKEKLETLKAFLSKGVHRSPSLHKIRNEVISNMSYQWNKEAETSFQRWKGCMETVPMEAETSFQRWKGCMETVPMVMPPTRGEALFLHIAASSDEIGAMLFAEQRRIQIPIYFVRRTLPDVEQSYAASEKLILALIHATRRLRRYFKDHPIRVLTDKPFERTFLKPDGMRRVVKWAKELEEYDIEYG